jgi:hypothetical protein
LMGKAGYQMVSMKRSERMRRSLLTNGTAW